MLHNKLPGPGNHLFFEIVAEGEVPQHFKEGGMAVCLPHTVDIACADTLLAGGNARRHRLFQTKEIALEGYHPRHREQQGGIAVGNQGSTWQDAVIFTPEKLQEHGADLIYCIALHSVPQEAVPPILKQKRTVSLTTILSK